ncbi:DUF943 family protein [Kosakonia sp. SMBL-WEM22]|uniref:DUF943 family protein n=1 Tax=Kosakonia sp. SMBL-WEM22 TaxID=2725560 RepID=UPI0016592AE0|nr:DUF943 family protein [Kosakonia sp. SMBL-WEM22]QNQ19895.1 DUF943 family protein [Kosakonia sp. SMBL-WEM22]
MLRIRQTNSTRPLHLTTLIALISVTVLLISVLINFAFFRQPEIMATKQNLNFSDVAVKNMPFTENGKIAWWQENKGKLHKEFNIPSPAKNGDWYISVWNSGSGFQNRPEGDIRVFSSETQDMICFRNDSDKCLQKDLVMRIENNRSGGVNIQIGDKDISVK